MPDPKKKTKMCYNMTIWNNKTEKVSSFQEAVTHFLNYLFFAN